MKDERSIFARVRAQTLLVRRLGEQIEDAAPGLRAMRLDDMPRAKGGVPGGLDVQMAKKDALERIAARESAVLREMEAQARTEMEGMKPDLYAFCALYYLGALSVEDTAQAIDRSVRQCMRYKSEIEKRA